MFYFQLLHKASFHPLTCFGFLLQPISGRYDVIKTLASCRMSVHGKHYIYLCVCIYIYTYILNFVNRQLMYSTTKIIQIKTKLQVTNQT